MIKESLDVLNTFRKRRSDLAKLSDDLSVTRNRFSDLVRAQSINNRRFTEGVSEFMGSLYYDDGKSFIPLMIYGSLLLLFGLGYATVVNKQYWIPVMVAFAIVLITVIYNVEKAFTNKAIEAAKKPLKDKIDMLTNKIDELSGENRECLRTYTTMATKIVNTYPIADAEESQDGIDTGSKPKSPRISSDFPSPSRMS
jgi:hypothetical protein